MKQTIDDTGSSTALGRTKEKPGPEKSEGDKAEMIKKMEAAGTPGPAHKSLETFVGNWKAEVAKFAPDLRLFIAHPSQTSREQLDFATKRPAEALRGCTDGARDQQGRHGHSQEDLDVHLWAWKI